MKKMEKETNSSFNEEDLDLEPRQEKKQELSQSKKDDMKKSLADFDLYEDDVDFDEDIVQEIKISKNTTDKILTISRMIKEMVLSISGYEEQTDGDATTTKYKLVKNPLASSEVIKAFQGLLQPYADESNLATKKDWDSYKIQALSDSSAFYKLCLREKASPEHHERTVFRIFQAGLINIGEVTCDNPQNMKTLFGTLNDKQEEDDARKIY